MRQTIHRPAAHFLPPSLVQSLAPARELSTEIDQTQQTYQASFFNRGVLQVKKHVLAEFLLLLEGGNRHLLELSELLVAIYVAVLIHQHYWSAINSL